MTLASLEARAEDAGDPKRRAAGLFVQGVRQFSQANFDEAARNFLEADALVPSSRALTNAISAARRSNNHLLVARAAQRVLARPGIEPEATALAREALADAARSLSLVEVRCSPEPCTLTLDGEPTASGAQYVLPGTHDFAAVGASGRRVTEHMSTAAGTSYRIALQHSDEAAPPEAPPEKGAIPSRDAASPAAKPLPPLVFWIGAAGTAGLVGLTTWSGLDALSEKHERESGGAYSDEDRDEISQRARRTNYFLAGAAVLGGATAVAGIWFVDWGPRAKTAVAPLPGGAALVTQGWF